MNKKNFIIILFSSLGLLTIVVILYFVLPKPVEKEKIVYSDDYLKNEEIFNFNLSTDKSYYIITGLKTKHQKDVVINIPNTIDDIPVKKLIGDQGNFTSWKNISQIVIPKNIEYIGVDEEDDGYLNGGTYGSSFFIASDNSLREFIVSEENETYSSYDGVLYNKDKTILLRYPNAKTGDSATLRYNIIDGVTEIYEKAFYMNKMLVSITMPNTVISIGSQAFYKCNNLTNVTFSSSLLSISTSAFFECGLQRIDLPESITEIRSRVFGYNELLEYVYIPSSVLVIGTNAFTNCPNVILYTPIDNVDNLKEMESVKNITIQPSE